MTTDRSPPGTRAPAPLGAEAIPPCRSRAASHLGARLTLPVRLAIGVAAALLVLPFAPARGAEPGGSGSVTSILFRLQTHLGEVALVADEASARWRGTTRAVAELVGGHADGTSFIAGSREATSPEESDEAFFPDEEVTVGSLLSATLRGIRLEASVSSEAVLASVGIEAGPVEVLSGFATLDGSGSRSDIRVDAAETRIERLVAIGEMRAFALGDLLALLGIDPLALGCEAIEDAGALLGLGEVGVDPAAACALLDDAAGAIETGLDLLDGARVEIEDLIETLGGEADALAAERAALLEEIAALEEERDAAAAALDAARGDPLVTHRIREEVQADHDAVSALCDGLGGLERIVCEGEALTGILLDLALEYGVDALPPLFADAQAAILDAIAPILAGFEEIEALEDSLANLDAQIEDLRGQARALEDALADLALELEGLLNVLDLLDGDPSPAEATCLVAGSAFETAAGALPGLAGGLGPILDALAAACDDLAMIVALLFETPLLRLEGVEMGVRLVAREGESWVEVTGESGVIEVGLGLSISLPDLEDVAEVVGTAVDSLLKEIAGALDIDLPLPEFEFFAASHDAGQREDGTWYAEGSVKVLRLHLPSGRVTLPSEPPLGLLAGLPQPGPAAAASAAPAVAAAAEQETEAVTLDLGVVTASGDFTPATTNGDPGDPPPGGDGPPPGGEGPGEGGPPGAEGNGPLPRTGTGSLPLAVGVIAFLCAEALRRTLRSADAAFFRGVSLP